MEERPLVSRTRLLAISRCRVKHPERESKEPCEECLREAQRDPLLDEERRRVQARPMTAAELQEIRDELDLIEEPKKPRQK